MRQKPQKTLAKFFLVSLFLATLPKFFSLAPATAQSTAKCLADPVCQAVVFPELKKAIINTTVATGVVTPIVIGSTAQPVADAVAPVVIVEGQGNVHYWNLSQNQTAQDLAKQRFYQQNCTNPLNNPLCGSQIDVYFQQLPNHQLVSTRIGYGQLYLAYKIGYCPSIAYGWGTQYSGPTFLPFVATGNWTPECGGPWIDLGTLFLNPVDAPSWESWPEADREKAVDLLTAADWGQLASTMPVAGKLNPGETVRAPEIIIPGADTDDPNTPLIDERLPRVVTPSYTLPVAPTTPSSLIPKKEEVRPGVWFPPTEEAARKVFRPRLDPTTNQPYESKEALERRAKPDKKGCKSGYFPREGASSSRHNRYATYITGSLFEFGVLTPEGDFAKYDGLQGSSRNVWEVKTGISDDMDRVDSQRVNFIYVSGKCGYNFRYAASDKATADELNRRWGWTPPKVQFIPFPGLLETSP
ncbi:MAG: hypothetical protein KME17_15380 [Cyanosarcina radialis HA8281-LM2]|nr:hypothetical protein [Cyanosarcina radialis HA8281-LM2]